MYERFKAGIVSVTFRQYAYENFIKYTKLTDLSCIEWGSDIHIPYNDNVKARNVADKMRETYLETVSYGSYYRLGLEQQKGVTNLTNEHIFSMILQTAEIINAPSIRVWGGALPSAELSESERKAIVEDTLRVAVAAKIKNKLISVEYHGNTITDNLESALNFIKAVRDNGGDNVYLYWQPNQYMTFEENKSELKQICPYLSNIHVFAWKDGERFPLEVQKDIWKEYVEIVAEQTDDNHNFLLEFVKGDKVEQLVEDAKILIEVLNM